MHLCSGNTSVVPRSIFMFSVNLQKKPRLPRTLFPNSLFTFFEKLCTGKFDSRENRCSVYIHQLGCMSIGFAFAVHLDCPQSLIYAREMSERKSERSKLEELQSKRDARGGWGGGGVACGLLAKQFPPPT